MRSLAPLGEMGERGEQGEHPPDFPGKPGVAVPPPPPSTCSAERSRGVAGLPQPFAPWARGSRWSRSSAPGRAQQIPNTAGVLAPSSLRSPAGAGRPAVVRPLGALVGRHLPKRPRPIQARGPAQSGRVAPDLGSLSSLGRASRLGFSTPATGPRGPRRDPIMSTDTNPPAGPASRPVEASTPSAATSAPTTSSGPTTRQPGLPIVALGASRLDVLGSLDGLPVAEVATRPRRLLNTGLIVPPRERGGRRERQRLEAARARRAAELADRESRRVGR